LSAPKDDREPTDNRDDEAFLPRWSRRKQACDRHSDQTLIADPEDESAPVSPPLCDSDMPPIETLDEESDFRGFLSPEVSDELRRLALRKLFHTATFNVRDGLDDYDDDLTQFAKLGEIITADIRHQLERVSKSKAGQDEDPGAPDADQPRPDSLAAKIEETSDRTHASADESANGKMEAGDPEQEISERVES